MKAETLRAADGASIAARTYESASPAKGSVVIGVRQAFYAEFAQWLAGQGWRVTTFDYRGAGDSRPPGSLKGFRADLFDWTRDYEAAIDHAHAALPGAPLYLLGHSLGAQLPGLLSPAHKARVAGLLSVAAGSGYWRENAPRVRSVIWWFWLVVVPLATRLCGYFPGKRLRKIGDIPQGVMLQWRRWCLNPRYSVGAEGEAARREYAQATFPVHALSIVDDELMTFRGTQSLFSLYENSPVRIERIAPADLGLRRIGHFGPFRKEHETRLWPRIEQWLGGQKGIAA
jgi:predicted alpha/beta hydrolase